jgi:hypothetical protein
MNSEQKENLYKRFENLAKAKYPITVHEFYNSTMNLMEMAYNLDRTPSPSDRIKTAVEILDDHLLDMPLFGYIKTADAIKAIYTYHNQFAWGVWISVEDRLAPEAEKVLCYSIEGWFQVGAFYHEKKYFSGDNSYNAITHWQPLPSPPQNTKES